MTIGNYLYIYYRSRALWPQFHLTLHDDMDLHSGYVKLSGETGSQLTALTLIPKLTLNN